MDYVSTRDITVASLSGRSVAFKKGVPTYAPDSMHAELIRSGVMPCEDIPEPEDDGAPKAPEVAAEREAAVFKAFEALCLRNKRGDFAGTGAPHTAVLSKELGWPIDAKERDALWQAFQSGKAA